MDDGNNSVDTITPDQSTQTQQQQPDPAVTVNELGRIIVEGKGVKPELAEVLAEFAEYSGKHEIVNTFLNIEVPPVK